MFRVILRWYGRWLHYRNGRALYRCVRVTLASSTAERTAHSRPDSNWQEVSLIPTVFICTTRGWRCSGRRLLLVGVLAKPPPASAASDRAVPGEAGPAPPDALVLLPTPLPEREKVQPSLPVLGLLRAATPAAAAAFLSDSCCSSKSSWAR